MDKSWLEFLSFSRQYTRSYLTMMACVGVAHKLLKKKKSHLFLNRHTKPCPFPALGHYILDLTHQLSPQRQLWLFGCKSIPSCSCPGEERKFQPVRICILMVILKGVGFGTPVTSSLRQVPILVNSD